MKRATSLLASASVGSLLVVGSAATAVAQQGVPRSASSPVVRVSSSAAPGSLSGVVRDERGFPVAHAVVSVLGAATTVAVTDAAGRFDLGALTPGPYVLRAHISGYVAPRALTVHVRAGGRTVSAIELRHQGVAPVVAAAVGPTGLDGLIQSRDAAKTALDAPSTTASGETEDTAEPSETAWRIRHARRGILKEVTIPDALLAGDDDAVATDESVLAHIVGTPTRMASFLVDAPITGQFNLLTSGSFDSPQQLFSPDGTTRQIANIRLGAPAGDHADWSVAGAVTQADISSWVVAGAYSMRAPAKHRYDVGLSYSTQRYDGGNPLAVRDVTDGSRNVGIVYGYDSLSLSPLATLAFGTEFARYDYLDRRALFSPRVELTLAPGSTTRLTAAVSRRTVAPGAEEFVPPSDTGIWLPPQRTFSSLDPRAPFQAERTLNGAFGVEQDLGRSTVAVRAYRQQTRDQLVTVFGGDVPGQPTAKIGHYLVGNTGDVEATGLSAEFRAVIASRVHGSVRYSLAKGQLLRAGDDYVMLLAPVAERLSSGMIQGVTTRIDAEVPETSTRIIAVYRVSNGFAQPGGGSSPSHPEFDNRFDVQVRQSLPFMNFTNARWEMLVGVRNFFRDASCDQSIYDELFVVRPPKRVVGGVTLHF